MVEIHYQNPEDVIKTLINKIESIIQFKSET